MSGERKNDRSRWLQFEFSASRGFALHACVFHRHSAKVSEWVGGRGYAPRQDNGPYVRGCGQVALVGPAVA